jgi:hypothetical protein
MLAILLSSAGYTLSQSTPPPGQPLSTGPLGQFQIVGDNLVSAQQVRLFAVKQLTLSSLIFQLFLGTLQKVYIIDKTENNPAQINGHPAWASGACRSLTCVLRTPTRAV